MKHTYLLRKYRNVPTMYVYVMTPTYCYTKKYLFTEVKIAEMGVVGELDMWPD